MAPSLQEAPVCSEVRWGSAQTAQVEAATHLVVWWLKAWQLWHWVAGEMVRYDVRRQEVLKMLMVERPSVFMMREGGKARTIGDLVVLSRAGAVQSQLGI